jgi:hypothetical protein
LALTGCPSGSTGPDAGSIFDWSVGAPFAAPSDALAGTGLTACSLLDATRCSSRTLQQCAITDVSTRASASNPDPLLQRAVTFERWYELYHSPDGQTAER